MDAVHNIDAIKDFILLDLPDFDSKDENNRRNAMRIAPELDGIVWVASPEKYETRFSMNSSNGTLQIKRIIRLFSTKPMN